MSKEELFKALEEMPIGDFVRFANLYLEEQEVVLVKGDDK